MKMQHVEMPDQVKRREISSREHTRCENARRENVKHQYRSVHTRKFESETLDFTYMRGH